MILNDEYSLFFDQAGNFMPKDEFFNVVQAVCEHPKIIQANRVALCLETPSNFAAALLALSSLNKEVILLPNYLLKTKEAFKNEYDFCLDKDIDYEISEKSRSDFLINEKSSITLFTSGSQGKPKKIKKSFYHLLNEVEELERLFGEKLDHSYIISTVSHQHIYGLLFRVLWPLLKKRPIANFNFLYPEELIILQKKLPKTALISSPAFLKRLELEEKISLEVVFSSGGKLESWVSNSLKENLKDIYEIYGSTETGGVAYKINQDELWTLFPSVLGKTTANGCLEVNSPFILDNFFQTSDMVEFISDKQFILKGRIDRIYKIEEKRISLDEIESKLRLHPEIEEASSIIISDEKKSCIGCVIVFKEEVALRKKDKITQVKEVKNYLSFYFERVTLPKKYRFVEKLPFNEQSKIDRDKLLELFYVE